MQFTPLTRLACGDWCGEARSGARCRVTMLDGWTTSMRIGINATLTAMLLAFTVLARCSGDLEIPVSSNKFQPIAAEGYRAEIESIDQALFPDEPLDEVRREKLSAGFTAVATRLTSSSPVTLFHREQALELQRLAEAVKDPRRTSSPAAVDSLRNEWMRIRSNLFNDEAWFARSAADLNRPAPSPTPAIAAADIQRVRSSIDRLEEMIGTARPQVQKLGDPVYDERFARGLDPAFLEGWAEWRKHWTADLMTVNRGLPDEKELPRFTNSLFKEAVNRVHRAIGELSSIDGTKNGLAPSHFEDDFAQAEKHLAKARDYLSDY